MDYDNKVINRMKRIEGQVRGVIKMLEDEKECRDVVTQMTAVRSALDRAIAVVVSNNLEKCIIDQVHKGEGTEEIINEAVNLLVKSR